jgi:hypothetical protein
MSKSGFVVLEWNDLARRGIGMSFGKHLRPHCRAKGDRRKICWRSPVTRRRQDEADHTCACASLSLRKMAMGPGSATEFRYAVIHGSSRFKKEMRGMIATGAIISGANPIPPAEGPRAGAKRAACRHVRACRPNS